MYLARSRRRNRRSLRDSRLATGRTETSRSAQACLTTRPGESSCSPTEAEKLIESDLVLKLNAPSEIEDTSWIRPGKTTFPWWNDFYEEDVPFKTGPEHGDGEALHRLLCRARHPVPFARRH